jgi:Zn-dependent protease with chaperone function
MIRRAVGALLLLAAAGCASTGDEGRKVSWVPKVPGLGGKGGETTMLSRVKPAAYESSSLAAGEERDLARHRGDGLGFVRSAALEQYLNELRGLLILSSGKTGVPGRVVILADPSFAAFSTPDGNVYISMGALETIDSADEVAALLAHELSHVLLKHHTSDLVADTQKRGLALYEIAVAAKTQVAGSRTTAKDDTRNLLYAQVATHATDKLMLPAWSRGQEREADFLGLDLLVESKHSPPAMISMLEKLQAWEKANAESEEGFQERMKRASQRDVNEALGLAYQKVFSGVSANHPKTAERIEETAQYLDRHYGSRELPDPKTGPWKAVMDRPDIAQVVRNYKRTFSAKRLLDQGKAQEAYAAARAAATGRTATDAYPNWILARSAAALGRQTEAIEALRRAVGSTEPVALIYEELILTQERMGNVTVALDWTDRASKTFGGAPRWTPHKIRLLRKAGRVAEAGALALSCSVSTPDWKRLCQEANQTPTSRVER